jgi:hypothetical protein
MELSLQEMVKDIKASIGHQEKFDAALIVIKITDYRENIYEVIAMKAIKEFLDNLSPQHVFVVVTHCDIKNPDPTTINEKIESLKKSGGIDIKKENVILFNNTAKSLQPLINKLTRGNMNFTSLIDQKRLKVEKELF